MKLNQIKITHKYVSDVINDINGNSYIVAIPRDNNVLKMFKSANNCDFEEISTIAKQCDYECPEQAPHLVLFKNKIFCSYCSKRLLITKFKDINECNWQVVSKTAHSYSDSTFNPKNLKFKMLTKYNEQTHDEELFIFYTKVFYRKGMFHNLINIEAKKYNEGKNEWSKEYILTEKIRTRYRDVSDEEYMTFDIQIIGNDFYLRYEYKINEKSDIVIKQNKNIEQMCIDRELI